MPVSPLSARIMSSSNRYNSNAELTQSFRFTGSHLAVSETILRNSHLPKLPFAKMQALGNDFVLIDGEHLLDSKPLSALLENWNEHICVLSQQLCSRHFGIGADGVILALNLAKPELARLAKRFYGADLGGCTIAWIYTNSDGSQSQMCGNGLRCLTLWAQQKGLLNEQSQVLTAVGPKSVRYVSDDAITVDLGVPTLSAKEIPFAGVPPGQTVLRKPWELGNKKFKVTCVNMGNPHCVIFEAASLFEFGCQLPLTSENQMAAFSGIFAPMATQIQADSRFVEGVNVSFVLASSPNEHKAVVWERGCGPTLACGSAAAAILVAGVLEERNERKATIVLPGGKLLVEWSPVDQHVSITGPARVSYKGEYALAETLLGSSAAYLPIGASS
jgi:diaminopimelate epimerase